MNDEIGRRSAGFYWVRIGRNWTLGEFDGGHLWLMIGDEQMALSPGSEPIGSLHYWLDEIGSKIPNRMEEN